MAAVDPGLPPHGGGVRRLLPRSTLQLPLLRAPIHRPPLPSRWIAGSTSSRHRVHLLLPPPSSAASRPLERCGELRLRRRGELRPRRHRGTAQRREPPLRPLPRSVPPARSGSQRSEGEKRSMSSDSSSWGRALVQISPYIFSAIGIAISIGVSVLGAAWTKAVTASVTVSAPRLPRDLCNQRQGSCKILCPEVPAARCISVVFRYSLGAKADVGELSFFSGASGNTRGFTIDSPTDQETSGNNFVAFCLCG